MINAKKYMNPLRYIIDEEVRKTIKSIINSPYKKEEIDKKNVDKPESLEDPIDSFKNALVQLDAKIEEHKTKIQEHEIELKNLETKKAELLDYAKKITEIINGKK
jgi:chromosome segregation ATPase